MSYFYRVCEDLDVDSKQGLILAGANGPVTLNIVSDKGNNGPSFTVDFVISDKAPSVPSGMMAVLFWKKQKFKWPHSFCLLCSFIGTPLCERAFICFRMTHIC